MTNTLKKTFALAACILSFTAMTAQRAYTVTGVLQDSASGAPDAYTTVRLMPEGKQQVLAVCASDEQGRFTLRYNKEGSYQLQTLGLGRQPVVRKLTLGAETAMDLGVILTQETSTELGAATVVAAAPIVTSQIDRLSYSMSDDPDAQANTMIEMLRKVPLVTVDGQDNITINGKSDFKIYVNGKPNKMMSDNASIVLKSFPASVVKKVEVITDPGAKYDAEGVSGILNIVTATEAETSGYTVTPNLRMSSRDMGGNLFAMTQVGKLTLSLNGGVHKQFMSRTTTESEREIFADPVNHLTQGKSEGKNGGTFAFGGLEASYEFSAKDLLSASADMFIGRPKNNNMSFTEMLDANGARVFSYREEAHGRQRFHGVNTSVDYQHQFAREDQNLTLSYRFSSSRRDDRTTNYYSDLENLPFELKDLKTDPDGKTQEHTAQADFTTPFAKYHTLSVGAKYIYRLNRSDNRELTRAAGTQDDFLLDTDLSLLYRHRNDIASGYAEYMFKLAKFSARAGMRFESSHIKVTYPGSTTHEPFSTTLNDLVPSLNVAYNLKPTMMLRANYNTRIGRPDITYLSPYVNHASPLSISYGSPNLTSEKAHNFELNFSNFTQLFSVNLSASYATSVTGLTQYSFVRDGVQHTTYGNFLHSKVLDFNAFVNMMLSSKTTFMLNGEFGYSDFKSYRTGDHNYGFDGRIFAMLRQELPWKVKMNLGGGYNWPHVNLQGSGEKFYFYFGSLSKSFLKDDRLTVELHAFNIFKPSRTFRSVTETADFRSSSAFTMHHLGRCGIGLSWRFGSLKASVKKAARTIENDDVQTNSSSSSQGGTTTGTGTGTSATGAAGGMGM
ncbi:MAG: TonB-dependent receptor [Alloprevotella sp.]|nr:TonB-dependent receptor [Alloprevotella sp.]MBR1653150.1 TonB-dependent receptor [Alloprevotella sp.]